MNFKLFLITILFISFSCKKKSSNTDLGKTTTISSRLQYSEDQQSLYLTSGSFQYKIEKNNLPYKKIILLNASLVGYFTELQAEDNIIGISSPEYIYSQKIHQLIDSGKIENVGNEQKYDLEKILALKPDAIFTNHIEVFENTYELLRKNKITLVFLDEYLETKPLEKSKYLLAIGKLIGKENEAKMTFEKIEKNYNALQNLASKAPEKPIVLMNEIYGNQWFLPGGKTFAAQIIRDANANYILGDNTEEKAIPLSFEEVFVKAENAQFWVNAGNHANKKSLLVANPNYAKMKVFQKGKIYTVSGKTKDKANDYFETGVVRADLVLKDYIKIFHPQLLPANQLTYMKELK